MSDELLMYVAGGIVGLILGFIITRTVYDFVIARIKASHKEELRVMGLVSYVRGKE